jgi:hypothetical protein
MISPQYLAGLIDGEGYLGLLPSRANGLKHQSFEPVVKIGMTDDAFAVLETIRAVYNGTTETRAKKTKGNRTAYTITFKGKSRVKRLVSDVYPYLHVKKLQASLLLQFCDLPMTHSRHKSFDPKVLEQKIFLYDNLKRLKQPPATTE